MILALGPFFNAAKSPRHFLGRSQELMRHSDPILTTKIYTDAGDVADLGCRRCTADV